jgi:mRNA interferase MazF
MQRGDLVTVALQGDSGKPRPALVVQADRFATTATVIVLPLTGTLLDLPLLRVTLEPSETNGLHQPSQVMVHRPQIVARDRIGGVIGRLDEATMLAVNRLLALVLGLAD